MELKEVTYEHIVELSEEANALFEAQDFDGAIKKFKEALEIIPKPKFTWEASAWILTSIGDVYFYLNDYSKAKNYFYDAFNCPGGLNNPYLLLRLGQVLFETHDEEKAKEYLLRAYLLKAGEIFKEEDPKYLKLILAII
ncbi:tol-pal system YbgF family protein [Bacillus sp. AFS041924]|uniref:tetratricopeptide repeat protein n=1 Tax=Bacillus sp. AFS041924 TaxID=2033503 RepID=UPI000BFC71BE|nr:tetratricopeptide repeat protein [Bacillus sp. AFS041924]PGS54181.1 hypothetical protein COC46_05565 [Bacillus sp. AFS041924]